MSNESSTPQKYFNSQLPDDDFRKEVLKGVFRSGKKVQVICNLKDRLEILKGFSANFHLLGQFMNMPLDIRHREVFLLVRKEDIKKIQSSSYLRYFQSLRRATLLSILCDYEISHDILNTVVDDSFANLRVVENKSLCYISAIKDPIKK